jgi:hypothetical protein
LVTASQPLRRAFFAGLLLLALSGCATTHQVASAGPGADALWAEYERAVDDTRYPRSERVSRDLVPITTFFDGLVWDEARQRVLMVTWTQASPYTPGEMQLAHAVWFTPAPFVQRFCSGMGLQDQALSQRLRQRLGLPPDNASDAFVEMWIDPGDFFRPCPDPEVNDRECQVNLTTGTVDRNSSCPWSAAFQQQVSRKSVVVSHDHLDWMCETWASTHPLGKPRQSYPWTALGYTYDWAPSSRNHVGESEYVAPKGTPVVVRGVIPTAQYCKPATTHQP